MSSRRRTGKIIAAAVAVVLLLVIGGGAWMLLHSRAEEIPEELAPPADPSAIVVEDDTLPPLSIAELRGTTVVLALEDRESFTAGEGKKRSRAINRWSYPEGVKLYFVTDLEGFGLFKGKITEIMGHFRPEMRFPGYLDFEGTVYRTFAMPKGHSGTVVLDPQGEIVLRQSGEIKDDTLAELRALLKAEEPTYEPAPPFKVGHVSSESCKGKTCVIAYLAKPVNRADVPGGEGGFRGDEEEGFKKFMQPEIRLTGVMLRTDEKVDRDKVEGVVVGPTTGVRFKHWSLLDGSQEGEGLTALGIPQDKSTLVVIDDKGQLAFRGSELIRFYQFGLIADMIGIDDIEDGSEERNKKGP